jgi:cysteine-rich repeat protein
VALNTNAEADAVVGRPQVTTDGAGNWVAVWSSGDSLGGAIGADQDIMVSTLSSGFCGNGAVDFGEDCDDGNNDDGDGCSSACRAEAQNKDQQKCINALNKSLQKVASKQGKEILTCISNGAKEKLGAQSIEDCLTADNAGKVESARRKTGSDFNKKCAASTPAFGSTDPDTVNSSAVQKVLDLIHAIFGADLDSAIATETPDKSKSKCQQKVAGKVAKCQDTRLKEFNKCKKLALRQGADDETDLEACMLGDPKGKIAKACVAKVNAQVQGQCVPESVDLSSAFPGCDTDDQGELSTCLDRIVRCHVCRGLNAADALNRDCDEFDDGLVSGSCP